MSKTIAFIPARGGSKSISLKNIKMFCGEPLLYWVAKASQYSSQIDKVVVATDHPKIREVTQSFNFNKIDIFKRSAKNAEDHSSTESVIMEYLDAGKDYYSEEDLFVLVQATSPFLTSAHLDEALLKFQDENFDSMLSCVRTKRFFWEGDGMPLNYDYRQRPRRQNFEGQWMENGAFYISKIKNIKENKNRLSGSIGIYQMPAHTGIELDEEIDWILAENLMQKFGNVPQELPAEIKVVLTDVDGVLTDAGMYYSENGDELKKFNTRDGKGLELLRNRGIKVGIITSENTKLVERRAEKLKVDFLYQGIKDKLPIGNEIADKLNIGLENIAYIGDDINDLSLLSAVGFAACPSDASPAIKEISGIRVLQKKGGAGVVRELAELLLRVGA